MLLTSLSDSLCVSFYQHIIFLEVTCFFVAPAFRMGLNWGLGGGGGGRGAGVGTKAAVQYLYSFISVMNLDTCICACR